MKKTKLLILCLMLFCIGQGFSQHEKKGRLIIGIGRCTPDVIYPDTAAILKAKCKTADTLAILNMYKYLYAPDTVAILAKYCRQQPADTVAILALKCKKDSVSTPKDSTIIPGIPSELGILYIDHFKDRLGNAAEEEKMIAYALQTGHNGWALYDLSKSNMLGDPTAEAKMRNLFVRAKARGILWIEATSSGSKSSVDERIAYNKSCRLKDEKFDAVNAEWEPWWLSDLNAAALKDISQHKYQKAQCEANGMKSCEYWGWMKFEPFIQPSFGMEFVKYTDYLPHHYYQKNLSISYHKPEPDSLNAWAGRLNKKYGYAPIWSAEPAFSQELFKTKPPKQVFKEMKPQWEAKYPNLVVDKWYTFDMSFLEYSIPYIKPVGATARGVQYITVPNVTTSGHKKYATEE